MKKILQIVVIGLVLCAMLLPGALAVDREDGIGVWAVYDEDGEYVDAANAIVLGDRNNAYILVLNDNIYEDYTFRFASPEENTAVDAIIEDYEAINDDFGLGLFSLDARRSIFRTGIVPDSGDYVGDAYLLFIDMNAMETARNIEDLVNYRHISTVSIIDNDDGLMTLQSAPSNASVGAAILSKDFRFLGFYFGGTDGEYGLTAEAVVELFPQLEDFYQDEITTAPATSPSVTTPPATTQPATTPPVIEAPVTAADEATTEAADKEENKEDNQDKETKKLSKQNLILLAAAGVLLIGGGAAFLIIRSKQSAGSEPQTYYPQAGYPQNTDIPLQNGGYPGETQAADYYPPTAAAQGSYAADPYNMNQPTFNMNQPPVNNVPPMVNNAVPAADGMAQVQTMPGGDTIGATMAQSDPQAMGAPAPGAQMSSITIIGKGGHFAGQQITQQGEIIIGRQPQRCTLCYPTDEKGISSVHCRLNINGSDVMLTDLNSTYGTFVNGAKLTPNVPTALKSSDTFYLADPKNAFFIAR